MADKEYSYDPWRHRFAVFSAACTFLLIIAGALVTSTDSGLAVPDWPLSYGQLMPPMVGGIFYEHGHRMVATFVGLLTTIQAFWFWRSEKRRWVRTLAIVAWFAVVVQGLLGGITVLFLLPTAVSVSHATLAQSFFSITVLLAVVTSRAWADSAPQMLQAEDHSRTVVIASVGALFLQLVLGAIMRHLHAGLAVPDFPLAYGTLWPSLDQAGIDAINASRLELDLPATSSGQVIAHLLHRYWGYAVLITLVYLGNHIVRSYSRESRLRDCALLLFSMVLVQVLLGALTVWSGRNIQVTTAHVATGALLLATTVVSAAWIFRLVGDPQAVCETAHLPRAATV